MGEESISAFSVQRMSVSYGKTAVLWEIDFSVPAGHLVGIIGPNGAGKSSLIKSALSLVKPLCGNVLFFGKPFKKMRKKIAYVPQRESVDWDFPITVLELVLMGRYGQLGLFKSPRKADIESAKHYLNLVQMQGFEDRQINQLSGGQQQRVFLARALLQQADIYFLDEPFAGIDITTEKVIIKLLKELRDQGKTIFVVHHDLNQVQSYFDWLIMVNMRLIACGKTEDVFTPKHLNIAYGKNYALFDEALKLAQEKERGE